MNSYKNEFIIKSGETLIIREPKVADAQALIEYMKTVDTETKFLARAPGEFNLTLAKEEDFIQSSLTDETKKFLVAVIDNKIVGNCSVGLVMNKKRYKHRASMGISVLKDYWDRGIGKRLMQECIKWCKENAVEQLELEVVTENKRAISMYKNFGFEIYGTKKHALKYEDGTYAGEYFMIVFLDLV